MSKPDVQQYKCPKCGRIHPIMFPGTTLSNRDEVCSICKANRGTKETSQYAKSIFQRF